MDPSIITAPVSVISIVVTAFIAIRKIRQTAESQRVSAMHDRMSSCMIETFQLTRKLFLLLSDVAKGVVYVERETREKTTAKTTAYDRFTQTHRKIAPQFDDLTPQHEILFPEEAFRITSKLYDAFNDAIELAYDKKPINGIYPDTNDLESRVETVYNVYKECLEIYRKYMGSNALAGLGDRPLSISTSEEGRVETLDGPSNDSIP